jgi:hypothetical protein
MLEDMIVSLSEGRDIVVIAANEKHVSLLLNKLRHLIGPIEFTRERFACKLILNQIKGSVTFEWPGHMFDWKTLTKVGKESGLLFYIDHFAIEVHLELALRELHRWDKPQKSYTNCSRS